MKVPMPSLRFYCNNNLLTGRLSCAASTTGRQHVWRTLGHKGACIAQEATSCGGHIFILTQQHHASHLLPLTVS